MASIDDQQTIRDLDIKMGQSPTYRKHPGNIKFPKLIASEFEEYNSKTTSRVTKTEITRRILTKVKEYGGRFMTEQGDSWEEVDDETAREKVASSFRMHRKKLLKQKQNSGMSNNKRKKSEELQEACLDNAKSPFGTNNGNSAVDFDDIASLPSKTDSVYEWVLRDDDSIGSFL